MKLAKSNNACLVNKPADASGQTDAGTNIRKSGRHKTEPDRYRPENWLKKIPSFNRMAQSKSSKTTL